MPPSGNTPVEKKHHTTVTLRDSNTVNSKAKSLGRVEREVLQYVVDKKLKAMNEEERDEWLRKKIHYVPPTATQEGSASDRKKGLGKWDALVEHKIDDRLEFLSPDERMAWFGFDMTASSEEDDLLVSAVYGVSVPASLAISRSRAG